jgi:hypothetical protein
VYEFAQPRSTTATVEWTLPIAADAVSASFTTSNVVWAVGDSQAAAQSAAVALSNSGTQFEAINATTGDSSYAQHALFTATDAAGNTGTCDYYVHVSINTYWVVAGGEDEVQTRFGDSFDLAVQYAMAARYPSVVPKTRVITVEGLNATHTQIEVGVVLLGSDTPFADMHSEFEPDVWKSEELALLVEYYDNQGLDVDLSEFQLWSLTPTEPTPVIATPTGQNPLVIEDPCAKNACDEDTFCTPDAASAIGYACLEEDKPKYPANEVSAGLCIANERCRAEIVGPMVRVCVCMCL